MVIYLGIKCHDGLQFSFRGFSKEKANVTKCEQFVNLHEGLMCVLLFQTLHSVKICQIQ